MSKTQNGKTVFVCSTMYREDSDEMEQLLTLIYKLACHYDAEKTRFTILSLIHVFSLMVG